MARKDGSTMRKFILSLFLLVFLITPSYSATTLVKAISVSQLALDESITGFYLNLQEKIGIMVTNKNVYLLTEPTTAGSYYTIEKVPLPSFATDEKIITIHWATNTNRAIALQTNKNIYFFLYN